jgi:enterochelin esterase family protein
MLIAPIALAGEGPGARPPEFVSPEVSAERTIVFRIHAPKAEAIRVVGGDLPGNGPGAAMTKGDNGVWEVKLGPVPAGAYRYRFNIDGLEVVDPRNPATSQSNDNVWSLVCVPGSEYGDLADVPHGAVAEVVYSSQALGRSRRMHVYTPPGYEKGEGQYPVLYLLHGASDSDASWSTIGRAGFILDNLIAAGKAKPMIVVMPAGHTGPLRQRPPRERSGDRPADEFVADFTRDLRPYVEKHYRVLADRPHRAIAGLSMGGSQTLNIAFADLAEFGYVGVFSSGVFGIVGRGGEAPSNRWEGEHAAALDNAELKNGLELVWFGCGKEDFLIRTSDATVEMLKRHGFDVAYRQSEGGHTWLNWRDYLTEFAQLLFVDP